MHGAEGGCRPVAVEFGVEGGNAVVAPGVALQVGGAPGRLEAEVDYPPPRLRAAGSCPLGGVAGER